MWFVTSTFLHAASAPPDFERDIRPILADHCFHCHGQDAGSRKARLRLDTREGALVGGKSDGPAIVPGDPDASPLILRVASPHEDEVMPPPERKKPVAPASIEKLRAWILAGAEYREHWAFLPPQKNPLPDLAPHPIDAFVRAELLRENLPPSPPASPETLCRRLHLDLTGLPPTLAELDRFLAAHARSPDAAVRDRVDELLASPHYGEKWARHWLDAARYADSDGYEKDLPRNQWVWRDWVIDALNRDLPYDRFIVEQLAGDLLPSTQSDARNRPPVASTGFLRNGMVNEEGAVVNEQFRVEGVMDRIDCVGKAVLGLTLQCAQCHSHKYDPISHSDYYRLFASLNNTYERVDPVYTLAQQAMIVQLQAGISVVEDRLRDATPEWPALLDSWVSAERARASGWTVVQPIDFGWLAGDAHPDRLPDGSVISLGYRVPKGDMFITGEPALNAVTGVRLEALTHPDLALGGPGRNHLGTFAVSELVVEIQRPGEKEWETLALQDATADFADAERPIDDRYRNKNANAEKPDRRRLGPVAFLIDGLDDTAWSADRGPGRRNRDTHAVVRFSQPFSAPAGTRLRATLKIRHGGADLRGLDANFPGRIRISVTNAPAPSASRLPVDPSDYFSAWRETVSDFCAANAEIEKLWRSHPEPATTVLTLSARSSAERRVTHLLKGGAWDKPAEPIQPGVLSFLHPPHSAAPDRLALARWLVDPRSPTTARVAVNRLWQAIFGEGLVETTDDFGLRTPPPRHQALLDWLAVEFMTHGWSQKHLLRTLLTSATYRQSSLAAPAVLERDPRNRLLARGPRFRADAEVIRDIALHVSGLLHPRVGGPSVFPPLPASAFAESYADVDFWHVAKAPERYVRSLYVFRRRTLPDPALASFDAPGGEVACVRRDRSNTPLAALASLNETVFAETARSFALRILREGGSDDRSRVAFAWRLCTSRVPAAGEINVIAALLAEQRKRIAGGWLNPREIATGDPASLPDLPPQSTPADAAAWTIVARVLLNLDETLTKG